MSMLKQLHEAFDKDDDAWVTAVDDIVDPVQLRNLLCSARIWALNWLTPKRKNASRSPSPRRSNGIASTFRSRSRSRSLPKSRSRSRSRSRSKSRSSSPPRRSVSPLHQGQIPPKEKTRSRSLTPENDSRKSSRGTKTIKKKVTTSNRKTNGGTTIICKIPPSPERSNSRKKSRVLVIESPPVHVKKKATRGPKLISLNLPKQSRYSYKTAKQNFIGSSSGGFHAVTNGKKYGDSNHTGQPGLPPLTGRKPRTETQQDMGTNNTDDVPLEKLSLEEESVEEQETL